MIRKLLLPLAAGAAILGGAALAPAPASAHWASTPASFTHAGAQHVSDVVEVQRRVRRHHRRWTRPHWPRRYVRPYVRPYAYYPRRCGYVWSPRLYRHVYRCW